MPAQKTKQYRVANPRGIPEGVPVIRYDDIKDDDLPVEFFEGQDIVKPAKMKDASFAAWIAGGFVVEVTDG